jgi:2-polyprenyl-3-methyl-5-hydroxy-6-metoxy-1,4-benzoquinol methylase
MIVGYNKYALSFSVMLILALICLMINNTNINHEIILNEQFDGDEYIFDNGEESKCGVVKFQLNEIINLSNALKENWESLGFSAPWWSVLTGEALGSEIETNRKDEFYRSGFSDVGWAKDWVSKLGINFFDNKVKVIDLGCGVGRLSNALADDFREVICLDQSEPHLQIAKSEIKKRNVLFIQSTLQGLSNLPKVDRIFSLIVLQHSPPIIQYYTLIKLADRLNHGGLILIQIPTHIYNYPYINDCKHHELIKDIKENIHTNNFHMHPLSLYAIMKLCGSASLYIIDIIECDRVGAIGQSRCLLLRKY